MRVQHASNVSVTTVSPGRALVAVFSLVPSFELTLSWVCWFKSTPWVEGLRLSEPWGWYGARQPHGQSLGEFGGMEMFAVTVPGFPGRQKEELSSGVTCSWSSLLPSKATAEFDASLRVFGVL